MDYRTYTQFQKSNLIRLKLFIFIGFNLPKATNKKMKTKGLNLLQLTFANRLYDTALVLSYILFSIHTHTQTHARMLQHMPENKPAQMPFKNPLNR